MVSRITAEELADRVDGDAEEGNAAADEGDAADDGGADAPGLDDRPFTLVDTRPADSFEGWYLHGAENVPYDPTEGFTDDHREAVEAAAAGDPVVAVCGKGLTSTAFGLQLEADGYEARDGADDRADDGADDLADVTVVRGGMEAWSTVHEQVDVAGDHNGHDDALVLEQLQRRATGCLGYLVGDRDAGEAVVVDPTRQTDEFSVAAEEAGLTITAVVDTHVHADHLSGGPTLAERLDVPYFLGIDVGNSDVEASDVRDRDLERDAEALEDGQVLSVGDLDLRAIHTPGHTEAMANLVVDDTYLLTSDTLHVDSVGRTELGFGEDRAEEGAELLHRSLHDRLLELDDDLTVLPGHVSVTEDNRYEVGEPGEPIRKRLGDLREDLDLLGMECEAFVEAVTGDLPEQPDEYETVVAVNAGEESVETEEDAAELETGPNNCSA